MWQNGHSTNQRCHIFNKETQVKFSPGLKSRAGAHIDLFYACTVSKFTEQLNANSELIFEQFYLRM